MIDLLQTTNHQLDPEDSYPYNKYTFFWVVHKGLVGGDVFLDLRLNRSFNTCGEVGAV